LSAFCIDVTEVTVAQYRQCTREERNGVKCRPAPPEARDYQTGVKQWSERCNGERIDRYNHPINCVDWPLASAYCAWAGGALPTEAQWEYAARGEDGRKHPWGGKAPDRALVNACGAECAALGRTLGQTWPELHPDTDGGYATERVKAYLGVTPEGVFDLAGNVREWVQDTKAPYDPGFARDPVKVEEGRPHVRRGGSWRSGDPRMLRGAHRGEGRTDGEGRADGEDRADREGDEQTGFRCARKPDP
jgi:formylglycine-generating enzyme required for sulfatase activity